MMGATYKATDQKYITDRFLHQVQSEWRVNNRLSFNSMLAYTDYQRKTETTRIDFTTGERTLTTGAGEQDVSAFRSLSFRTTAQYVLSPSVSLQPGVDINLDKASAHDIETLGETVRNRVRAHSGIELRWEIRRMGHFLPGQEVREFLDGDVFTGAV